MTSTAPTSRLGESGADMLATVMGLGPSIAAVADRIETDGRLPDELVRSLTRAGVFQMYLPRAVGGRELDPLSAFRVTEELARHDASVGWCAQVAAAVTVFLAWLDPRAVAAMAGQTDGPLHLAGSARALGKATTVEGGYRVTGHWNYASGVRHANWFLATCLVDRQGRDPAPRSMLIPVSSGRIVDNWQVVGMRGTGSDDFVLEDVFVPEHHVASRHWIEHHRGSVFDPRLMMVGAWAPTAGVGVGIARGVIDALTELGEIASTGSPDPLRARPPVQETVAEAEAVASAARAFVVEALGEAWQMLGDDGPQLERAVARAQLAITHSMNEAVRVADLAFHAAGTNAISTEHRLERYFRDAHTAVQHSAGQRTHYRMAGRVLLGLDSGPVDPSRAGPTTPRP